MFRAESVGAPWHSEREGCFGGGRRALLGDSAESSVLGELRVQRASEAPSGFFRALARMPSYRGSEVQSSSPGPNVPGLVLNALCTPIFTAFPFEVLERERRAQKGCQVLQGPSSGLDARVCAMPIPRREADSTAVSMGATTLPSPPVDLCHTTCRPSWCPSPTLLFLLGAVP